MLGPVGSFARRAGPVDPSKPGPLPVLEGEGRVVGVVSDADLLPTEVFRDSDPALHPTPQRSRRR
jgi:hypothetical protein